MTTDDPPSRQPKVQFLLRLIEVGPEQACAELGQPCPEDLRWAWTMPDGSPLGRRPTAKH